MIQLLLVGLGGMLGAMLRYLMALAVLAWPLGERFPLATLLINIAGCLLIGLLAGLVERQGWPGELWRLFLMVGVLGGFTTFSAFGLETISLLQRDALALALFYVGGSVLGGLLAVWLGLKLSSMFVL